MKTIQEILSSINAGYTDVSDLIPNKFNFSDEADTVVNDAVDFNYFGWGNAICIQSDGKIVIGGQSGLNDGINNYSVIKRFNTDGSLDETFTSIKFYGSEDGHIRDIKQLSDGKLIVAGHFTDVNESSYSRIAKLNADGTLDNTFQVGSGFNNTALVVKIIADDNILIGGSFNSYNGVSSNNLAKLDVNGNLDQTFAGNISFGNVLYAIETDSSNNIYVGGGNSSSGVIVKLNSDGTTEGSFVGGSFNGRVNVIKLQDDGKLIVGGWFNTYDSLSCNPGVIRLNSDGTVDGSFASEGTGINPYNISYSVQDLKIQSDGKIVVGGWFIGYNDLQQGRIIRLNSDGTKDNSFDTGVGFDDRVQKIELDDSENIFCVGFFYNYNGDTCTSEFNYINVNCAGGVAKLNSTGGMVGTPLANTYKSLGINDGGRDMWDGGAYFNTDLTNIYGSILENESIPLTHSALTLSNTSDNDYVTYNIEMNGPNYIGPMDGEVKSGIGYFGDDSSYFTNLYPGLLVLAAKNINIDEFSITGGTGQDNSGNYNSGYIPISFSIPRTDSPPYTLFYKTSYGNSIDEPSINQLIIVDGYSEGITQTLASGGEGTDNDDHVLTGLAERNELYVLIFGRLDQTESTEQELTDIATAFLQMIVEPTPTTLYGCDFIGFDGLPINFNFEFNQTDEYGNGYWIDSNDSDYTLYQMGGAGWGINYASLPQFIYVAESDFSNDLYMGAWSYNSDFAGHTSGDLSDGYISRNVCFVPPTPTPTEEVVVPTPTPTIVPPTPTPTIVPPTPTPTIVPPTPTPTIIPCSKRVCETLAFKCYGGVNKSCTCAKMRYFYPKCTRANIAAGLCSGRSGAYVPAIIVCNQKLF